ncbi:MAG TPA: glycosyltransferase family protein [Burkholderiales bacterium]|nr:glycosyltransferase family protein [Burkholderiales bacterium]
MPNSGVHVLAILQARMSSRRLPGKVLRPILGRPMLSLQIERLRRCRRIDRLIVATSSDPSDAPIAELCSRERIDCFRGDLQDVLDRFYQAASRYAPEHVVRLTGDCPLADPGLIDRVIDFHLEGGYDFTGNALVRTFPRGLDVSVFRHALLREAWREAQRPAEREHVTLYMKAHPERYRLGDFRDAQDRSHLRWTVDEPADFDFVRAVYERLYPANPSFGSADVYRLLEREPGLAAMNRVAGEA